jgi:N-acetylglucosaminyl-diphospho-decaprenol L-rhamnosyltransferase
LTPQPNKEEKQPPRVSAVVVSHNRVELLRRGLQALEKCEGRERLQVIVIDNGSRDGSGRLETEFPNVRFSPIPKNVGLTKAMNIGWRAAEAEYVLFLHDDVELEPQTPRILADALDANADASAVCPLLIDEAGNPAPQLGELPPDGTFRPAEPAGTDPIPVEYPRGAALMVRSFVIRATRQIDERYGQFGADADIAAQIYRASRKILLIPGARAIHRPRGGYTDAEQVDFALARAAFASKYQGFAASLRVRIGGILGPLASFRIGEFMRALSGQKIDGNQ